MKVLALLTIMACAAGAAPPWTTNAANPRVPVLIELFTSEGCSSCPPADAWLKQLDSSQPIPGAQVIVLSEHVDYWDHDGWKDTFSSSLFTDRQNGYARALGISGPYTPQVIVDGNRELQLNEPQKTVDVFLKSAAAPMVPVSIGEVSVEGAGSLRAHIDVDGHSQGHNAEVYAAIALDHAESQVLRGENGGRRLAHVAVVLELKKIGKLDGEGKFSQDFQAKLKPGIDARNLRLVVFVQEPQLGKVLGAALRESSAAAN